MEKIHTESKLNIMMQQLRPALWHVGVASFFINLLILPVSLYSLQIYDRILGTGSISTLIWLTLTMILMFAAAGFLHSMRGVMLQRIGNWIYDDLAESCLPLTLTQASVTGVKGVQSLRDAEIIKQFFSGASLVTIMDAPWAILFIAVLFVVHYSLGFLVLTGALSLILLAWLNETMMKEPVKSAGTQQLQNMQELEFATRNADVIEAMGMGSILVQRWKNTQNRTNSLQDIANTRSSMVQGVTKFVRLSLQILVSCVAAWLTLEGQLTMGAIIAASILSGRALAPFEAAIGSWKVLNMSYHALNRLKIALNTKIRPEHLSPPSPQGLVTFEQLTFKLQEDKPLLEDINFSIQAGELLGIIGPSGSGKTTLARLAVGILPPKSGLVRLDHADVYTWPRDSFGKLAGYLPQDVELFDGTVKENIARMQKDAPEGEIIKAAQLANAHEFILHLPKGYETEIGVGGSRISAGQRQRIGLARAFYGSPCLLVLDEPDANLDDEGRMALVSALHHARSQRITTLIITHHKLLLRHVDKILLLRDGKMEAFDPAAQVIASLSGNKVQPLSKNSAGE